MDKFMNKSKEILKNFEVEKEKLKRKLEDKYEKYKIEKKQKDLETHTSSDVLLKKKLHSKTFSLLAQTLLGLKPEDNTLMHYDMNLYFKPPKPTLSSILKDQFEKIGFLDFHSEAVKSTLQDYYKPKEQGSNLLHCIAVIGFHHKKGSIVEFLYPNELLSDFDMFLTTVALPDAAHQNDDDYVYFTYLKEKKVFYGVSCFRQIAVSEEMKAQDKELTRGFVQKAVCIVSETPLFGSIMSKLEPITKAYFKQNNFKDNEVLMLFKAIMLEKRILVYSNKPSAVSNFILALLALLPGCLHFTMDNSAINLIEAGLSDYALPLRIFNNKTQLLLYFTINNFPLFDTLEGYLLGTTNSMIKGNKKAKPDIIVDLDLQKLEIFDEKLKKAMSLNDHEKEFITNLIKKVSGNISEEEKKSWKQFEMLKSLNPEWEGSEDWIRQEFSKYLKKMLSELALFMNYLQNHKQFKTKSLMNLKRKTSNEINTTSPVNSKEKEFSNPPPLEIDPNTNANSNNGLFIDFDESDDEEFEGYISRSFANVDKKILLEEVAKLKEEKRERKQVMKTLKKFNLKWILLWSKTANFQYWLQNYNPSIANYSSNQIAPHEKELVLFENGDIYVGNLERGVRNGLGLFYDKANKHLYNGGWDNNERNGQGVLNSLNNEFIYDGEFFGNKKHGFGKLITPKMKYSGNFKNDVFAGAGVLIDSAENIYDGEFLNGLKSGIGKWHASNGDQYIGEFKGDTFHGKGQYIYASGDIYSGDFMNGKKHGYGVFQQKNNNSLYQGEWENDNYNGQGILTTDDGTSFQGYFTNGVLNNLEKSIIKFPNGDNYTGQVYNGIPEGQGILKSSEGDITEGIFHEGKVKQKL